MPSVYIDEARGGTLCVDGVIFGRGLTPIPEGSDCTVEAVERAVDGLKWARVVADDKVPAPNEGAEAVVAEPRKPALPVSAEKDVAVFETDPETESRAERLAELVEHDGEPPKSPAKTGEYPCPKDDCEKVLRSENGLKQHLKLKHAE